MTVDKEWITAIQAWRDFVSEHPELGYRNGKWPFYNFLRIHKESLIAADAIRWAKNRFWIANTSRFSQACFRAAARSMRAALPERSGKAQALGSASVETAVCTGDDVREQISEVARGNASLTFVRAASGACILVLRGSSAEVSAIQAISEDLKGCMEEVEAMLAGALDPGAQKLFSLEPEQQGPEIAGEPTPAPSDESDLFSRAPACNKRDRS